MVKYIELNSQLLICQLPTDNPLACGCDMAWIVLNPDYMIKLDHSSPTCADGTLLTDLDPQYYIDLCK